MTSIKQQKPILLCLALSCCFIAYAQSNAGITNNPDTSYTNFSAYHSIRKDYPNAKLVDAKVLRSVKQKSNITYCSVGERRFLLDVFYPSAKSKQQRVAVMIIHGGGWRTGNRTQHSGYADVDWFRVEPL